MPKSPQNLQNVVLPQIPQEVIWGFKMTKICIFGGPNYLPRSTTNTAAYKCISLFCNTFLPSGKAVLVLADFARIIPLTSTADQ